MALDVAPTPAKPTAARTDTSDRAGGKPAGHGKGAQGGASADFLALLMGIELEAPTDALADTPTLAGDGADADAKDPDADLLLGLQLPAAATPTPETQPLPGLALPQAQAQGGPHADGLVAQLAGKNTVDLADKPALGARRRGAALTETAAPMGTQQLQADASKSLSGKAPDVAPIADHVAAALESAQESVPQAVTALAAPVVTSEDARKAIQSVQAKVEMANNLTLLSSGLSGAMAPGNPTFDISAPGAVAQFQSVVADEVAYYISNDVQNAEMKLEGVGGGPVEVSINMQGKEAQVVFRTDEVQTRAMLEGATTQLKDMLQQQGVVLTGVYVGTSGAGAGGDGEPAERRFRQGNRSDAAVRVAAPELQGSSQARAGGVGRTLDLYV